LVTGQLTDMPTRGLDIWHTIQLAVKAVKVVNSQTGLHAVSRMPPAVVLVLIS